MTYLTVVLEKVDPSKADHGNFQWNLSFVIPVYLWCRDAHDNGHQELECASQWSQAVCMKHGAQKPRGLAGGTCQFG